MEYLEKQWKDIRLSILDIYWFWGDVLIMTIKGGLIEYIFRFAINISLSVLISLYLQFREKQVFDLNSIFYPYFINAFLYSIPIVLIFLLIKNSAQKNRFLSEFVEPEKYISLIPYNPEGKYNPLGIGMQIKNNNANMTRHCYITISSITKQKTKMIQAPIISDISTRDSVIKNFGLPWKERWQNEYQLAQIPGYTTYIVEIAKWNNEVNIEWSNRNTENFPEIRNGEELLIAIDFHAITSENPVVGRIKRSYFEIKSQNNKLEISTYKGSVPDN